MNLLDTLRSLGRRWYIVVPGLLLAVALAFGAWKAVPPKYERSATQLLLPGSQSVPEGGNPYLYLGGLSQATDVMVSVMGSPRVLDAELKTDPGAQIVVTRDASSSGPVIRITVTAGSDAKAASILDALVKRTGVELAQLQAQENVPSDNRITDISITVDTHSTVQQKTRITVAGGAGIAAAILALIIAGMVDALSNEARRRKPLRQSTEDAAAPRAVPAEGGLASLEQRTSEPTDLLSRRLRRP